MRNFFKEIIITLVLAIVIFLILRMVVGSYSVISVSMQPGLYEGERILVNKVAYRFGEPDRGDIIIFQSPEEDLTLIKRVIGLPGDTVEVKNNTVYINGVSLNEPYLKEPPTYSYPAYNVPAGRYFVLGDNRNDSRDSHTGWTVPVENVVGRAWLLTWPPSKWGSVSGYPLNQQLTSSTVR
jgi:signal peptidase I